MYHCFFNDSNNNCKTKIRRKTRVMIKSKSTSSMERKDSQGRKNEENDLSRAKIMGYGKVLSIFRNAMILLPNENRYVLKVILGLLDDVSKFSDIKVGGLMNYFRIVSF